MAAWRLAKALPMRCVTQYLSSSCQQDPVRNSTFGRAWAHKIHNMNPSHIGVHFLVPYLMLGLGLPLPALRTVWLCLPYLFRMNALEVDLRARYLQPLLDSSRSKRWFVLRETIDFAKITYGGHPVASFHFNTDGQKYQTAHDGVVTRGDQQEFLDALVHICSWYSFVNSIIEIIPPIGWGPCYLYHWIRNANGASISFRNFRLRFRIEDTYPLEVTSTLEQGKPILRSAGAVISHNDCLAAVRALIERVT